MWWELRRSALVIFSADAAGVALAIAACAVFSTLSRENAGTAIFVAGAALLFIGVGLSSGGRFPGPLFASHHRGISPGLSYEVEVLALERSETIQADLERQKSMSWTLLLGIAGLLLLPLGGFLVSG